MKPFDSRVKKDVAPWFGLGLEEEGGLSEKQVMSPRHGF